MNSAYDPNDITKTIEQMTQSHLNNIMQLALFYTANYEIYAINISKIQHFVILDEIQIVPHHEAGSVIVGVAHIRDELVTFVNLDRWLGIPVDDCSIYNVGIVCNFNNRRTGFLVRDIIRIEDKYSYELKKPNAKNLKLLYVTKVEIDGKEQPCSVFDAERLLDEYDLAQIDPATIDPATKFNDKLVLIAEDSVTVANRIKEFFRKLEIAYEIYENGADLIARLKEIDPSRLGMVITDLEMPTTDGYQVISFVRSNKEFENVPVVVHSSMTGSGIVEKIRRLGAIDLINKSDSNALYSMLVQYLSIKED